MIRRWCGDDAGGERPSSASALSCCLVCGSDGLTDGLTDSMATTAMAAIGRRRVRAGGAFPGSGPSPSEHKVTQVREQAIGQYLGGVEKVEEIAKRAGVSGKTPHTHSHTHTHTHTHGVVCRSPCAAIP